MECGISWVSLLIPLMNDRSVSVCLFQVLHMFDGVETHVLMEQNWYTQVNTKLIQSNLLHTDTWYNDKNLYKG